MPRQGFSLPELLVALAIGGILLALAVPSLARQRATSAVGAAANQTLAALHLARRLALARGQTITVCPSDDGASCRFGGTEWLVFANRVGGSEARREPGEEILRRWMVPAGLTIAGTRGYASFLPRPGAAATVTFQFSHAAWPSLRRSIVISQTGRPRLER